MCGADNKGCGRGGESVCGCGGARVERFMEACLLMLLAEEPSHGYDLMSRLDEFGFSEQKDPGMVYRTLRRLEKHGMITSQWDISGTGPAKRTYQIAQEGLDLLDWWASTAEENIRVLQTFLARHSRRLAQRDES